MNILDRYIIKNFLGTIFFSLFALCIIYLIVNLLENLDEFLDQDASFGLIAEYYIYTFPEIIKIITPIATLLSTLFTIGRMSTTNEITAMKSGGMSLYRLMIPLVFFSLAISLGQLYFNGWIVPEAVEKKLDIESKYLKKGKHGGPIYNLYFRDNPTTNVVMRYYNAKSRYGNKVSIETYTEGLSPRLVKRTEAQKIKWDTVSNNWMLIGGISREYSKNKVDTKTFDTLYVSLKISHSQIVKLKKSIKEMNLDELRDYIALMKQGGKDVRKYMIDYYGEYAFPFANFIVILFGVPFASVRKKGGIALQIGAAMVISIFYLLFLNIGKAIGYSMSYEPWFFGWLANMIFFIAGIIVLFRTKT